MLDYIKKNWWYLVLLFSSSVYVFINRTVLFEADINVLNPASLLFVIWILLMLFPLFSELNFFGIKLKKEVDEIKSEVRTGMSEINLKLSEIKISNSSSNQIQIDLSQPLPSESQVEELKKEIEALKVSEVKDTTPKGNNLYDVSEASLELFQIRLTLEKLINEISSKYNFDKNISSYQKMNFLSRNNIIDRKTFELFRELMKIANRGVHGEIVSDKYIDFVHMAFPTVQANLKRCIDDISKRQLDFGGEMCPECNENGYFRSQDICRNCGFSRFD